MGKEQSPLQQLIQQYGIDNIPDDALAEAGYIRESIEGGMRLRSRESIRESSLKWEEKTNQTPFGRTEIIITEGNETYRGIYSAKEEARLQNKLIKADLWENFAFDAEDLLKLFSNSEPIQTLFQSLKDYFQTNHSYKHDGTEDVEELLKDWMFSFSSYFADKTILDDVEIFLSTYKNEEGNITSSQAQLMYDELERTKAIFTDIAEAKREFVQDFSEPFIEYNVTEFYPYLIRYCKKLGLKTRYQVTVHFFEQFLQRYGMTVDGQLSQTTNPEEAVSLLLQQNFTRELTAEEKNLKKQLKSATNETRIQLNAQIKEIVKTKKWRTQVQQGMLQYFQFPDVYVQTTKLLISDAQQYLVTGKKDNKTETKFILDATPDENYDQNPGKVSGDCTKDRPLPFRNPNLPLYNVKVFSETKNHLGNIYLFVTHEKGTNKPVWHLEAIQIPKRTLEWPAALESFLRPITKAAQQKNIWELTVNHEPHFISNYDFIQHAAIEFHDKYGVRETEIFIPLIKDKEYSEFQSTGEVRILWKNPEYKDL